MGLGEYLEELKKVKLLEPDQEAALWTKYKVGGDSGARRQLIESYQPLVFKAAMRWKVDEARQLDLIQEGTVGLIEAVESYDPARKVAFCLYAVHRIRGRILNYIEQESKQSWTYIDHPVDEEEPGTYAELLIDAAADTSQTAERNFLAEQVRAALHRLPLKEQAVLSGMYFDNSEPKKLAQSMDLSLSHIYRLQKQGVRRIRGMLSRLMQNW